MPLPREARIFLPNVGDDETARVFRNLGDEMAGLPFFPEFTAHLINPSATTNVTTTEWNRVLLSGDGLLGVEIVKYEPWTLLRCRLRSTFQSVADGSGFRAEIGVQVRDAKDRVVVHNRYAGRFFVNNAQVGHRHPLVGEALVPGVPAGKYTVYPTIRVATGAGPIRFNSNDEHFRAVQEVIPAPRTVTI